MQAENAAKVVRFIEFGPHKTIEVLDGPASGKLRVSDQRLIDALREAFEKAGFEVVDVVYSGRTRLVEADA